MRMIKGALEWIKRLANPIWHDANTSVFANPRETSSIPFSNYPHWCRILCISRHGGQRRPADPSTLPSPHGLPMRLHRVVESFRNHKFNDYYLNVQNVQISKSVEQTISWKSVYSLNE